MVSVLMLCWSSVLYMRNLNIWGKPPENTPEYEQTFLKDRKSDKKIVTIHIYHTSVMIHKFESNFGYSVSISD